MSDICSLNVICTFARHASIILYACKNKNNLKIEINLFLYLLEMHFTSEHVEHILL